MPNGSALGHARVGQCCGMPIAALRGAEQAVRLSWNSRSAALLTLAEFSDMEVGMEGLPRAASRGLAHLSGS